ncbi:sensor domain-containing protein [Paenibacillus agricola]|uniref:EAL domain-containing protein n=1 Tax=Paenibacillus agricola TaxID=2716264 RepID=A0ABX0JFF5_9BACL|nr:EAL domain-containing protein [Paenibacillus agricola]NHN33994.1 EAL domain-containing protein [Paenibacillus agricola]
MRNEFIIHKDFPNLSETDHDELVRLHIKKNKSFEIIQKIANLGTWEYDYKSNLVTWSQQMFIICGITTGVTMQHEDFFKLVHPKDRKQAEEKMLAAIENKTEYEIELRLVRPSGEVRYVIETVQFMLDSNNELATIIGVIQDVTENKSLRLRLKEEEQYYESLFNNNADSIFSFDLEGNFLSGNKVLEETFGYSKEELLKLSFKDVVEPECYQKTLDFFMKTKTTLMPQNYESIGIHKNGDRMEFSLTNIPIIINGELVGVYGIAKNITDKKVLEQSLREADIKYRSIVEQSIVGVFIAQHGKFVYTNPHLNQLLGQTTLLGTDIYESIHPEDRQNVVTQILALKEGQSIRNLSHRTIKQDGTIIIVEVHYTRIIHQGEIATIGTVLDVTDRKKTEELNQYIAYHDYLTELPNRRMFEQRLGTLLSGNLDLTQQIAVMLIDLDRFKLVNDTLGHAIGDALLNQFATKLQGCCLDERQTVYRLSGDEFCIILTDIKSQDEIEMVSDKILQMTKEEFIADGYELHISASIGISRSPENGSTVDSLFKHADTALYYAKSQGRNQVQYYTAALNMHSFKHFALSNDLRKALAKDELFIQYMPRVQAQTTEILGVEALVRWNHPDWGLVSPAEFVPIAEETGLIIPIGEWVLREACKQNKRWQDMGFTSMTVSVNFSVKQLLQQNILQTIDRIVEETGLSPEYLEIEITESSFISNEKEVIHLLDELKKRKIKVSLDDFGTGFSSLYLLKQLSLDTIKIDKSFVEEILTNPVNKSIIECILSLAKAMNMNVVAEGVETAEQYAFLKSKECDEIQGYYFSRPLDIKDLEALLKSKQMNTQLAIRNQAKIVSNRRGYSRLDWVNPLIAMMEIEMFKDKKLELGIKEVLVTHIGAKGLNFLMAARMPLYGDTVIKFRIEIFNEAYEFSGKIAWFQEMQDCDFFEYGVQFQNGDHLQMASIQALRALFTLAEQASPAQLVQ